MIRGTVWRNPWLGLVPVRLYCGGAGAARSVRRTRLLRRPWPWELVDHPFYYRKDRMASAVAAHPYGTFDAAKRQDIAAFAELKGLRTTWPEDFPSWCLPGRTTLVVYTPLTEPAQ